MTDLEKRAMDFAYKAHEGQKRKYSDEPYIVHPEEVVMILRTVTDEPEVLAAGWLHDTVEDCGVKFQTIFDEFGFVVGSLVFYVTDLQLDGNRKLRKMLNRLHISGAPREAQTVKLADLISNTRTIVVCDPDFAKVYMREKRELLAALAVRGDWVLWNRAKKLCDAYFDGIAAGV